MFIHGEPGTEKSRVIQWVRRFFMEALQWANNEKVRLCEVSSLDRQSLYEPFMYLASKLNPPPNKSALATITSTIKRERNKAELD